MKKQFRVLHLIRPAVGGMKNHLFSLLRNLDKDLFEIIISCPEGDLAGEIERYGSRPIVLPLKGELSPFSDWKAILGLVKILKEERVTILHAHSSKAGFVGRVAAYLAGTPAVFMTAHNSIFYEDWPVWKHFVLAGTERLLDRVTDRVLTVSEALRQEIIKREGLSPDKVITVHNGIDMGQVRPPKERRHILRQLRLPPLGQVVGTVARLAPQKGVTFFLKAAAMLVKDYQVNFIIIGDGPLLQQLQKETAFLGLKNRVFFAGKRDDVFDILPVFNIFVLPSLTEGFPLTVLEALAAARPVVATKVGGVPEIIKDNHSGLLVNPGDPAGLALAIARLLNDREKALSMGQAGQVLVREKFTAAQMVCKVEEEYKKMLIAKGLSGEMENSDFAKTNKDRLKNDL